MVLVGWDRHFCLSKLGTGRNACPTQFVALSGCLPAGHVHSCGRSPPAEPARRTEATARLPQGTFTKSVDVPGHGSGQITWTYDGDRVRGRIAVEALGGELELATDAEVSLSRAGTVYGLITAVRVERLKPPTRLGDDGKLAAFAQIGLWPAVEPLVNEVSTDLPFSYQARQTDDRLSVHNDRILLAGPNPLGKLGAVAGAGKGLEVFGYFQALGRLFEGTDTREAADAPAKPARKPARVAAAGR